MVSSESGAGRGLGEIERNTQNSCKVGDTLSATVTGADDVTYSWALNGTAMATTATYTVPASAKDGDEIKLTVTDEDGQTASDKVYVGGLTILKVEPLAQGATYKYVKAYFSSALTSLAPSEIEIRGKKDQKLYSIQTATLSTDGMAADLTLYGNNDSDLTTFLWPNTTYVMTLTQNGQSTSLEFELPAYMTDKIVTSVDTANNKFTVVSSFRTGETGELWEDADYDNKYDFGEETEATFNVAGKYAGNLGTLIGRTVNFQYDTDANLTAFALDEADVVYGAMQYVNDTGNMKDGYYKDKITGTKYKNSVNSSSTKNVTRVYNAYDGSLIGFEPAIGTYQYAKLVLNPDGTVSTAFVLATLDLPLYVTEVDGTKVIQDGKNGADLDGFIIVKDDEYVKPADLELGDVVFVNLTRKFADVYNNEVTGEISNVISEKLDLDDKTYTWKNAQYYDPDDDVYKKLETSTTAKDTASQNYLNSLDPDEDTTIWLNRKGDIAYIKGTVTGTVTTTDVVYLAVDAAKTYQESLKDMLKIKVFDGSDTTTLAVKMEDLKYFDGKAGKYTNTADDWNANTNKKFGFDYTDAAETDFTETEVATIFPQGQLLKATYNEAGTLIGLTHTYSDALGTTKSLDNKVAVQTANSPNLTDESTLITAAPASTANHKFSMGSYTNLWICNEKDESGEATSPVVDKDDAFSKVTLTEFENEIITTNADDAGDGKGTARFEGIAYRVDGTKATDVVVKILNDRAYKAADENTINGMLVGTTKNNNYDNNTQVINTITIIGTDGVKATYTADGTLNNVGGANNGDYVALTQNKSTKLITAVSDEADWQWATTTLAEGTPLGNLAPDRAYDSEKLNLVGGTELTVAEGGAILLRYTEEGSVKHKVVTYSDVNTIKKAMKVWYNETYLSDDGTKAQSDMIVVEEYGAGEGIPVATVTMNSITGQTSLTAAFALGTATLTATGTVEDYELWSMAPGATGFTYTGIDLDCATDGKLTIPTTDAPFALTAGTSYTIFATTSDSGYVESQSNIVVSDAAVATGLAAGAGTWAASTTAATTAATITGLTVLDQYGDAVTTADSTGVALTITDGATTDITITAAQLTWDAAGAGTVAVTGTALNTDDSTAADKEMRLDMGTASEITLTNTGASAFTVAVADI